MPTSQVILGFNVASYINEKPSSRGSTFSLALLLFYSLARTQACFEVIGNITAMCAQSPKNVGEPKQGSAME